MKLPVWAWIAVGVVGLGAIGAAGNRADRGGQAAVVTEPTVPEISPTAETNPAVTEADTTTAAPTTTEAPAPTTTELPHTGGVTSCNAGKDLSDPDGDGWGVCLTPTTTSTTIDPAVEADVQVALFGTAILGKKQELADVVSSASYSVDSVDLIDFQLVDRENATFTLAVTSGYNGIEYRDQIAWELAKALVPFWADDGTFRNDSGVLKVRWVLTIDTTTYIATYDQMRAIDEFSITSTDWINGTRQP